MYQVKKIYDSHVHAFPTSDNLDKCVQDALDYLSFTGVKGINILQLKGFFEADVLGNDSVYLYLKALYPDKFSVYNGIAIGYSSIPDDAQGLAEQVQDLIDAGFDGLKMINNKSTLSSWGFEFDDARMDPMWDLLEETRFPIIWHIGNTERWPAQRGPGSEAQNKAPYHPGNEPNNDPIYRRLEHVLEKHPKLNLTIPHWLFMCENGLRLTSFMERHPNVNIDITPGSGMYYYMSQNKAFWRDFILQYQDRLVYGTDNFMNRLVGAVELSLHIRRYLETDETYFTPCVGHSWGFDISGLGPFSEDILDKIYWKNFERIRGGICRVDPKKAADYLRKEQAQIEQLSEKDAPPKCRKLVADIIGRFEAMTQQGTQKEESAV